jgi:hypothetical protein
MTQSNPSAALAVPENSASNGAKQRVHVSDRLLHGMLISRLLQCADERVGDGHSIEARAPALSHLDERKDPQIRSDRWECLSFV